MAGSQIKRFLILIKELDADDGELTRTQKGSTVVSSRTATRRSTRPSMTVRSMCHLETEVTFEDGRKGMIKGDVRIVDMQTYPSASSAPMQEAAE